MRAVQLRRFGGPEVLEIVDIPTPVPGPGEVLVNIRTAGINFFEVLMRENRYAVTPELPMIPGVEVAGVIDAIGEGVSSVAVGAHVVVPMFAVGRPSGGYAEYLAVDAASVVRMPKALTFADAVALMVQGLTALHLVRRSAPANRTVLVTAAAGGVGSLLVQLAKSAGARRVVAAASSKEKLELARSLGADAGVDYSSSDWVGRLLEMTGGEGAEVVYDCIGGAITKTCIEALAPCGELVFGALGRFALDAIDVEKLLSNNQSLKGFALSALLAPNCLKADLADLFEQVVRGKLKVTQGGSYPLDRVAEAHRALESRQTTGKIVLVP